MISVVTPAFNEQGNLRALYERLAGTFATLQLEWEWIVVDDHSLDTTFAVVSELAATDPRVRGIRLSRNSGSHVAITCGLHHAAGDAVALLAADLQDPPELLREMVQRWQAGAQVVWAVRRQRPGKAHYKGFAAIYYWIMRRLVGMTDMPGRGADFFLIDRVVVDAFRRCVERNTSVLALITWLGFRQEQIEYDKRPRATGQSGWTLARQVKLLVDSVTAFSDFPLRWCAYGGAALVLGAILLAMLAVLQLFSPTGLVLLTALITAVSGLQLLAIGVVGQYLWRALDEARGRPIYTVQATVGRQPPERLPASVG